MADVWPFVFRVDRLIEGGPGDFVRPRGRDKIVEGKGGENIVIGNLDSDVHLKRGGRSFKKGGEEAHTGFNRNLQRDSPRALGKKGERKGGTF